MNFLRFFFSKLFVKQLLWAGLLVVLFIGLCFWGLNQYTQHGKHTQVPDIEALSLETVASAVISVNTLQDASIDSLEVAVEEGGTYLRQTAVFTATNLFTLPQPVAFGTNDDLTVYVNGVFVDFVCRGGNDIDFTGLLAYDVDAKDKVQVMGIKL